MILPGTTVLAEFDYTVRSDGQRTDAVETQLQPGGSSSETVAYHWTYDNLNRLTDEVYDYGNNAASDAADYTTHYTMDLVGNRLAKATDNGNDNTPGTWDVITGYTVNARDQLTLEYTDANANGQYDAGEASTTYGYDFKALPPHSATANSNHHSPTHSARRPPPARCPRAHPPPLLFPVSSSGIRGLAALVLPRQALHQRQQNRWLVQLVIVGVTHRRDLLQPPRVVHAVDPGRHDHAVVVRQRLKKLHVIYRCPALAPRHRLQLMPRQRNCTVLRVPHRHTPLGSSARNCLLQGAYTNHRWDESKKYPDHPCFQCFGSAERATGVSWLF